MRFWDTSALLPLFVAEPATPLVRRWLRDDPEIVVWALTRVELLSAFARRRRERSDASADLATARAEALDTWDRWAEVTSLEVVRRHAERLVETHPLRAADALQIGAALAAARDEPALLPFVTLDDRQVEAASREGFPVFGPR